MIIRAQENERVLIVQPYIPTYRVPLFHQLRTDLASHGIALATAAAGARGPAQMRHDDLTSSEADFVLAERRIGIGHRYINSRDVRATLDDFQPTLVVVEQAIKNLETWEFLIRRRSQRFRTAMWGQGRSSSTMSTLVGSAVKMWLTRRADWFFAYTEEGASYVTSHGLAAERVTVLRNAIDSRDLKNEIHSLNDGETRKFRRELGLSEGKTGLFLGGVDKRKGVGFLLDAAQEIGHRIPGFKLMIGGAGSMVEEVQSRQSSGQPVVYLGRLDGARKARALACADVMLIPQWIGLVAVDSLTAGLPVVTTQHASHSPEFAYLTEGESAVVTEHRVSVYAEAVARLLNSPEQLKRMGNAARIDGHDLTIEEMSRRFADGIVAWAETPRL